MKDRGQVAQKLKQARFRALKRELTRALRKKSANCRNCVSVKSPGGPLGVCSLDYQTCDPKVEDRSTACEVFEPRHDPERLKGSLKTFFKTAPVHEIAVRFPDVAALLWVLIDTDDDPQRGALFPEGVRIHHTYLGIDLWVDTQAEAELLGEELAHLTTLLQWAQQLATRLEVDEKQLAPAVSLLVERADGAAAVEQRLEKELREAQDRVTSLEASLATVEGEKEELEKEVEGLEVALAEAPGKVTRLETPVLTPKKTSGWKRWFPWIS